MSYGFEVRNENNQVVLDANSINFVSESNQNFTTNSNGIYSPNIKLGVYLVPLANNQMLTPRQTVQGLRTFRVRSGSGTPPPVLANTTITTRRIVAFNEISPPTNYGMAVANSSGELVFHTDAPLLSVLSVQRFLLLANQTSLQVSIPANATHFIVQSGWRQFVPTSGGTNTIVITVGFQKLTSTTARIIPDEWGVIPVPLSQPTATQDCPLTMVAARIL
jgi:hypothetical protein